jgi:hypothetical protein
MFEQPAIHMSSAIIITSRHSNFDKCKAQTKFELAGPRERGEKENAEIVVQTVACELRHSLHIPDQARNGTHPSLPVIQKDRGSRLCTTSLPFSLSLSLSLSVSDPKNAEVSGSHNKSCRHSENHSINLEVFGSLFGSKASSSSSSSSSAILHCG